MRTPTDIMRQEFVDAEATLKKIRAEFDMEHSLALAWGAVGRQDKVLKHFKAMKELRTLHSEMGLITNSKRLRLEDALEFEQLSGAYFRRKNAKP